MYVTVTSCRLGEHPAAKYANRVGGADSRKCEKRIEGAGTGAKDNHSYLPALSPIYGYSRHG